MPQHAPGSYFGRPIRFITTELGENKVPCIVITFDVTHRGDEMVQGGWASLPNPEQRDVKMFMSDNAWPYTEAKLKAFGFNGDFGRPDFAATFKEGTELVCMLEERKGKTYEQWDFPRAASAEAQPASSDAVRLLNAKWKQANATAAKPAGAPPAPPVRRIVHQGTAPTSAPAAAAQPAPRSAAVAEDDGPPF